MKPSLFLICLFYGYGMRAQKAVKPKPDQSFRRVAIGMNFSPDLCYRTIGNSGYLRQIGYSRTDEHVKFGYTLGFDILINFTKLIGLETGVQYSNKGYQVRFNRTPPSQNLPQSSGVGKWVYNDHYLDIPLKVNFTAGRGKFRFCGSAGLIFEIFLTETSVSDVSFDNKRYGV